MKFLFLGTADFGIPALQNLIDNGHTCCGVVTNPPKPFGRGRKIKKSQVHTYCEENGIAPIFTPENLKDEAFINEIRLLEADIYIVVAFSILPKEIFSIPPKGTFNIHAALLPKFRGPAPIQRAIECGEKESGVTLFRIDTGVDTGNILLQKRCGIADDDTTITLYDRLSKMGGEIVVEAFSLIEKGQDTYSKQDDSAATKAPLLYKSEAHIDWTLSAEEIYNKVRAFKPFPGTYTMYDDKKYGIEWGMFLDKEVQEKPGTLLSISKNGIEVACGKGIFVITEIKPAGKRAMAVADFINGTNLTEGILFE